MPNPLPARGVRLPFATKEEVQASFLLEVCERFPQFIDHVHCEARALARVDDWNRRWLQAVASTYLICAGWHLTDKWCQEIVLANLMAFGRAVKLEWNWNLDSKEPLPRTLGVLPVGGFGNTESYTPPIDDGGLFAAIERDGFERPTDWVGKKWVPFERNLEARLSRRPQVYARKRDTLVFSALAIRQCSNPFLTWEGVCEMLSTSLDPEPNLDADSLGRDCRKLAAIMILTIRED